jgi:hypothetical protein
MWAIMENSNIILLVTMTFTEYIILVALTGFITGLFYGLLRFIL